MRMMSELNHLYLYSSNKKVYVPIDERDKRHNSAIMLLTPNIESTMHSMQLPYIYNPALFTSFYIDRSISAYINKSNIEDFDEQEAETISEAMVHSSSGTKFKFDYNVSTMDEKYIRDVYNSDTVKHFAKELNLNKVPDKITIIVHPTVTDLRKNAPKYIKMNGDNYFSYFENGNIHLLSKLVYDPFSMRGNYDNYLLSELLYALIISYNNELPFITAMGIAYALSGILDYMKKEKHNSIDGGKALDFSNTIVGIIDKSGMHIIQKYIRTNNINLFTKYTMRNMVKAVSKILFESELSYIDRQRLLPSDFGIPEKRKYPIHDEDHVRAAIRMFNNCDPEDEKELATAIIKKMNRFGITDVRVSASNRFRKYYQKKIHESSTLGNSEFENNEDANWDQVQSVCSHLSSDELGRITFTDAYRDSKYVIKRIIGRVGKKLEDGSTTMEPAGFLDVYHFPSNPSIAQIVIAVDERYRGLGVADNMVKSLINSELEKDYDFDLYYWTAHEDNYASQHIALKNGFKDTDTIDKYGRKVFIRVVKNKDDLNKEISNLRDTSNPNWATVTEDAIITESASLFFEANDSKHSTKLKNFLYSERIKNDKEVLLLYKQIRSSVPQITRTFLKLKMYKRNNIFVDLSYYHELFLRNNIYRMDNAVNLYFDFLNRLINNRSIDEEYSHKTIFIPVGPNVWSIKPDTELTDYRKNLNPISTIFRLIRINPGALRKAWGDKKIVFVADKGYFTVDFNRLDISELARFKKNINRLMSTTNEVVTDDEEAGDTINDDPKQYLAANNPPSNVKFADTSAAMAARIIDKIEYDTSIKIDDVSAIGAKQTMHKDREFMKSAHLHITSGSMYASADEVESNNGIVVISIDPDGPKGYERLSKTVLDTLDRKITTYCMPGK